jgi:malonyl-CoA O-methyltransferase
MTRSQCAKLGEPPGKRANFCAMEGIDDRHRFDRAAASFDAADFVHATTRDGLFARMEPMNLDARTIIDLGSATGSSTQQLSKTFRRRTIIPVDLSHAMLKRAVRRSSWLRKTPAVQADARLLPFVDQSIDLVFANLLLPWIRDRERVFSEVARVLSRNGLFVFSTLGPDSLRGLRHGGFADMHNVGDELVRAGLLDPVLDVDRLTVAYKDPQSLDKDLRAIGATDCVPEELESLDVELELVYGHCWGRGTTSSNGEIRIDPGQIGRRNV